LTDFSAHDVHQKDILCPFAKRSEKNCNFRDKILVIRKTEAGEKCGNVCSSLGLAPATVSTVMGNAEKIK
jgi:hypothetical protein